MIWARSLLVLAVGAGCAGQLDLAPEAYQASAQTSGPGGGTTDSGSAPGGGSSDAGVTPSSIGSGPPAPWPPAGDAAASPADTGSGGNPMAATDAGWGRDAATTTAVDTGSGSGPSAADSAAAPTASVCPAGVDAIGLMAQKCGGCHGDRTPAKGLDLVTPGLADRLVGIKSTCPNQFLLDVPPPGAVAPEPTGYFLAKLAGAVDGCGARMPYGAPALAPAEFDCIVEWAAHAVVRGKK